MHWQQRNLALWIKGEGQGEGLMCEAITEQKERQKSKRPRLERGPVS